MLPNNARKIYKTSPFMFFLCLLRLGFGFTWVQPKSFTQSPCSPKSSDRLTNTCQYNVYRGTMAFMAFHLLDVFIHLSTLSINASLLSFLSNLLSVFFLSMSWSQSHSAPFCKGRACASLFAVIMFAVVIARAILKTHRLRRCIQRQHQPDTFIILL